MEAMISTDDHPRWIPGRSLRQVPEAGPCGTTQVKEGSDDAATVPVDLLSLSSLLSQANWELHVSSKMSLKMSHYTCTCYDITSHHILQYNQHSANTSLCIIVYCLFIYLSIYLFIVNTPTTIFIVIIICMS